MLRKFLYVIFSFILVFGLVGCGQNKDTILLAQAQNGMDSTKLDKLDETIKKLYPQINSVVILRHGNTVFEKYYNGTSKETLNEIRSATKSVLSALVGIAVERGDLKGINQKALDFFPEYKAPDTDKKMDSIEIKHLLTMTSGIPYNFADYSRWIQQDNPIKWAFETTLATDPGSVFNYNDPGVHILSGILTKATKMKASEYADKYLFNELGIKDYSWLSDNQGNNIGAAELTLTTRDMAKFGQLYLQKGKWDGKQVVPEEWVEASTIEKSKGGPPSGSKYGYLWWVTEAKGYSAFYAMGYGGQFIYVVPDLDLVVAITSGLESHHEENRNIVTNYIIPAITK